MKQLKSVQYTPVEAYKKCSLCTHKIKFMAASTRYTHRMATITPHTCLPRLNNDCTVEIINNRQDTSFYRGPVA